MTVWHVLSVQVCDISLADVEALSAAHRPSTRFCFMEVLRFHGRFVIPLENFSCGVLHCVFMCYITFREPALCFCVLYHLSIDDGL